MARKLFTAEIGLMIDCWFDDDDDASDDCSVVSDFQLDEEELGNFLHESNEEVSNLESCSSTDKDEPSPPTPQSNSSSFFTDKNGNVRYTDCPPPSRTRACNLRHTVEGPLGNAKLIGEEVEALLCFFEEDMLRMIIEHTNKYGENYNGKDNWSPVDLDETKSILGFSL